MVWRRSSAVETWDRIDRQLAADRLELGEVQLVLGASRKALEANDAGEGGYANVVAVPLRRLGAYQNGVVVKRRQAATHDVDDAVAAVAHRCSAPATSSSPSSLSSRKHLRVDLLPEAQHRGIGLWPIGHEQIGVLGGTHVTMEDHAEAADDHILQADRIRVARRPSGQDQRARLGTWPAFDRYDEQRNRLLGELLPLLKALGGRQRHR